MYRVYVEAGW